MPDQAAARSSSGRRYASPFPCYQMTWQLSLRMLPIMGWHGSQLRSNEGVLQNAERTDHSRRANLQAKARLPAGAGDRPRNLGPNGLKIAALWPMTRKTGFADRVEKRSGHPEGARLVLTNAGGKSPLNRILELGRAISGRAPVCGYSASREVFQELMFVTRDVASPAPG